MERRKFITTSLATGLTISQLNSFAMTNSQVSEPQKPFIVKAGKARFEAEFDPIQNTKISARDTGGQMSAFENINETGPAPGPPLHIHPDQDETFFIVEGDFLFQIGEEKIKVGKGDVVLGPRGVAHTFFQLSKKGHMIFTYNPAGNMEEIFRGMSKMFSTNTFNPDLFAKLCKENGVNFIGPPMKGE